MELSDLDIDAVDIRLVRMGDDHVFIVAKATDIEGV